MKPGERGARLVSSSVAAARDELLAGAAGEAVDLHVGRNEFAQVGVGQDGAVTAQRLASQQLVDLEPQVRIADVDLVVGDAHAAAVVCELLVVGHDVAVGRLAAVDLHDAVGLGAGLGLHDQVDVVAAAEHHVGGVASVTAHLVERAGELAVGARDAGAGGQFEDLCRLVAEVLELAGGGQLERHADELLSCVGLRRRRGGRVRVGRATTAAAVVVLRGSRVAEARHAGRVHAGDLADRQRHESDIAETQKEQERLDVPRLPSRGGCGSCRH